METTRLSSKGQVILPKSIRVAHHWEAGVEFTVETLADGVLLRPIQPNKDSKLEDVIGCIPYKGPAKTLEEMDAAIAAGVKGGK